MSRRLRILVVDGNYNMAKALVERLRAKGFETETAHSAFEALEKVASATFDRTLNKPFDCVLSDVKLPEGDGVELCRAVKAIQPGLPVALMTSSFRDHLIEVGIEGGAIAVLAKPLDIERFTGLLTSVLAQERGRILN